MFSDFHKYCTSFPVAPSLLNLHAHGRSISSAFYFFGQRSNSLIGGQRWRRSWQAQSQSGQVYSRLSTKEEAGCHFFFFFGRANGLFLTSAEHNSAICCRESLSALVPLSLEQRMDKWQPESSTQQLSTGLGSHGLSFSAPSPHPTSWSPRGSPSPCFCPFNTSSPVSQLCLKGLCIVYSMRHLISPDLRFSCGNVPTQTS